MENMKIHTTKIIALFIVAALFLTACNMDFLTDTDNIDKGDECSIHYVYEDSDDDGVDDTKYAYNCEDTLLWWEEYQFDDEENKIGVRRYNLNDTVKWTILGNWERGNKTLEAYFLPSQVNSDTVSHEMQWYTRFGYGTPGASVTDAPVQKRANYNAEGVLQWFEACEYSSADNLLNKVRYTGAGTSQGDENSLEGQWLYTYEYDNEGRETQEKKYTPGEDTPPSITTPEAVVPAFPEDTPHAFSIPLPKADSLTPLPEMPSFDPSSSDEWALSWTLKSWYHDGPEQYGSGQFSIKYDDTPKPLELSLSSDTLEGDIRIALEYYEDEDGDGIFLPKSKVTTYKNTEVLNLGFEYTENSIEGLVKKVTTSGEALLIPLDYEIEYNDNKVPRKISIKKGDTTLQYFVYSYKEDSADGDATVIDHYLDPLNFGGRVDKITHFDGNNNELGKYSFTYDDENEEIKIEAEEYDAEEDEYSSKGYFLIELVPEGNPAEGQPLKFSSYSPNSDGEIERQWYYEYAYDEQTGKRIQEARYKLKEEIDNTADKYELSVPEDLNPESFALELLLK